MQTKTPSEIYPEGVREVIEAGSQYKEPFN